MLKRLAARGMRAQNFAATISSAPAASLQFVLVNNYVWAKHHGLLVEATATGLATLKLVGRKCGATVHFTSPLKFDDFSTRRSGTETPHLAHLRSRSRDDFICRVKENAKLKKKALVTGQHPSGQKTAALPCEKSTISFKDHQTLTVGPATSETNVQTGRQH